MKSGFKKVKVLIVGGAGFIGGNLSRKLLEFPINKLGIVDNLLSSEKDNVPKDERVEFIKGSIKSERILSGLKDEYEYVFHLATFHGNQSSIHNPLEDHENNLLTTLKLFERIKGFKKLKKVVYASAGCSIAKKTSEKPRPTKEDDPVSLHLDSPYAISKLVGELYANYFHKQHGLPTVIARFQNVYGPGEILGAGKWRGTAATVWRNVVPTFVYKALKKQPLAIYGNGSASRDFVFVDDIVQGLILCANRGKNGDVYNLASGKETTILNLAKLVNRLTDNPKPMEFLKRRKWDTSIRRFGSTSKAKKLLGFEATTDLQTGLKKTIGWTANNMDLIEKNIRKHKNHLSKSTES